MAAPRLVPLVSPGFQDGKIVLQNVQMIKARSFADIVGYMHPVRAAASCVLLDSGRAALGCV